MTTMRAKMQLIEVTQMSGCERIKLVPVASRDFGPQGESEDNTYARYTPCGELTLTISNPDLRGVFKPGQRFYLDFKEVAEP